MRLDAFVGLLARLPLFQGLAPDQLHTLVRMGGLREFEPGDAIAEAGEPAPASFVTLVGRADMDVPEEPGRRLELGPGSLIGDVAMFVETEAPVTVRARDSVLALELSRPVMRAILEHDSGIADVFAGHIRHRLHIVAQKLDALAGALSGHDAAPEREEASAPQAADARRGRERRAGPRPAYLPAPAMSKELRTGT